MRRKNSSKPPLAHSPLSDGNDAIWALALEVWQDEKAARQFLLSEHPMLGGRPPAAVANESISGAGRVEQLLGRLAYGSAA
jgi:uncharacterized protein (DUF2384 family)